MMTQPMARLVVVALSVVLLSACTSAVGSSLDKEADTEARKYVNEMFVTCGQDTFSQRIEEVLDTTGDASAKAPQMLSETCMWKGTCKRVERRTVEQYRGLTTAVSVIPLSEAERLNGITWLGRIEVKAPARRVWSHEQGAWEEWKALTDDHHWEGWPGLWAGLHFSLVKKHGQWEVVGRLREKRVAPDCASIPQ